MKNQNQFYSLFTFFYLYLALSNYLDAAHNNSLNTRSILDIGVILDLRTPLGNMSASYISMARDDLDANHDYTTKLKLYLRDSNEDTVKAASMALDLLKNVHVKAIIGPQTSGQAQFIAELASKAQVPILSFFATSPFVSTIKTPYFIRTAPNDSSQVQAIAAIIQAFGWKQVVPIYEDTLYGAIPNLTDALQDVGIQVHYKGILPYTATDDQIGQELSKLEEMHNRVFVVHLSPSLGSRLFLIAKKVGMMSEGYVWIITDGLANLLDSMNSSVIQSMQGVLGVRRYFQHSQELENFMERWRSNFPNADTTDELIIYGLWAYDTVWALANAVERVGIENSSLMSPETKKNSTDLERLGVFEMGPKLRDAILETNLTGLSGKFSLIDGQLEWSVFQIVNVAGKGKREIGFWTRNQGLQKQLNLSKKDYSASKDNLKPVIWPGELVNTPSTWKKLKIGVPKRLGFTEFVMTEENNTNDETTPKGYSIDVFEYAVKRLPYGIDYKFVIYQDKDGNPKGSYNDLIDQVYFKKFDAVVGDTTIVANRSLYVDFTLPYTESGVTMIVLANEYKKQAWIFLKPLSWGLWLTTGAAFVFTGIVVWALEHRVNDEFRGPLSHQVGVMLWFSFSTLVFAHRERLVSNWSRFVVVIWVFVAWILTTSYTASFTSLLTIEQLQPAINDIDDLIKNNESVGYGSGSFVADLLRNTLNVEKSKLKNYTTVEQFAEALSKGTKNGGVGAIFDEIPYLRLFLAKNRNCAKYKMAGPVYKTDGFGFVFPKGFPLVADLSRAILNLTEGEDMKTIEKNWIGSKTTCSDQTITPPRNALTLDGFWGLFLITGAVSVSAVLFFLLLFLYNHIDALRARDSSTPFWQRLVDIIKRFNERDLSHHTFSRARPIEGSEMMATRLRRNSLPADASLEPPGSNPNSRASVVFAEIEDDARHFQTAPDNWQSPARRRWNMLYRAWRFRTRYARLDDYN